MGKRIVNGVEFELSSGNVFLDLGLPDAEELKIKSAQAIEIARAVHRFRHRVSQVSSNPGPNKPA
jgi:predicted XRE-type DNA-binding protein